MKISTYLMCAAFVGGLIVEAITMGCYYRNSAGSRVRTSVTIEKTPLAIAPLTSQPLDTIIFTESPSEHIDLNNFKGMAITVSDTARTVSISMPDYWRGIIIPRLSGSTLTVDFNCDSLARRLSQAGQLSELVTVKCDSFRPLSVIIPRAFPVPFVRYTCRRTLYVDSLTHQSLSVDVPGRVVLNGCDLASFTNRSSTFRELKLDNSTIVSASLKGASNGFDVECVNPRHPSSAGGPGSHIDTLAIDKMKYVPNINLQEAEIGVLVMHGTEQGK